ncbi:glycerol kinase [Kribbella sp. VKM Ac-2527]|uniref:ATP:glycerol 3-phosphotransferase n=1 Tax=Kribbella caucasensis TaxID=2512215 RepID=A0A4R6JDA3_9ACTN|nr:FGGY family carbohydrate kinase [Kribbella sp. VKM Ac-2527]TDO33779.1 glycerol kinase [Kribbella sp. VKM Ac-2527]
MSPISEHGAVLAIDQGTTNTKAVLVDPQGVVLATASAPAGLSLPRPGWAEQDADEIWASVLTAVSRCLAAAGSVEIAGLALSTQRESVAAWDRRTGKPVGPVIGWQDVRTAEWCETLPTSVSELARGRTGLRVDAMFSAPKINWLLSSLADLTDVCVGTIDSWLIWKLTGCREHLTEAGNASRTLLYDVLALDWSDELLAAFGVPGSVLPEVRASNAGFGVTSGVPGLRDGIPVVAVLADSHAAMYGQGCTEPGMIKATYGTGSSVMTPTAAFAPDQSALTSTLAWLTDEPLYALEGNIISSGAALAWTAGILGLPDVGELATLAATVPDAGGVTLVPAFSGLGAPHWDRNARATFTGMSNATTRAHLARASIDAVAHQICDITELTGTTPHCLRADGGATAADLLMQTQADLLGYPVEVANIPELSALGAAQLAHQTLNAPWPPANTPARTFTPSIDAPTRQHLRTTWSTALTAALAPGS